jgi:hypothetical protein
MKVFQAMDGFLWADVTPMADMLWATKDFELYAIYEDKSEHLIENEWQYLEAINDNLIIAIELCFLHEITPLN